jgi:hypothetical protein
MAMYYLSTTTAEQYNGISILFWGLPTAQWHENDIRQAPAPTHWSSAFLGNGENSGAKGGGVEPVSRAHACIRR